MKNHAWIKGSTVCDGLTNAMGFYLGADSFPAQTCLAGLYAFDAQPMIQLARVIERLFPSRCTCEPIIPMSRVIHFNNHPETTREDVDKVLLAYTEELESAGG